MDKTERRAKRTGWTCYLVALLILLGAFSLLLPVLETRTLEGNPVAFESWKLFFGGLQTSEVNGTNYSFAFGFNYFFLVTLLLLLLSVLAVTFGRNTPSNLMVGMVLLLLASIALIFAPHYCSWTNGSIPYKSISYSYGFFLAEAIFFIAFICLIFLYVKSRRYWRAKSVK